MKLNNIPETFTPNLPWSRKNIKFKMEQKPGEKFRSLSDTGVTLDELYNGEKQIIIHIENNMYKPHVILRGRDGRPDCKVSSFGLNLWARTSKGTNYERYSSLGKLQTQLKAIIDKYFQDDSRIIYFSITDEVSDL